MRLYSMAAQFTHYAHLACQPSTAMLPGDANAGAPQPESAAISNEHKPSAMEAGRNAQKMRALIGGGLLLVTGARADAPLLSTQWTYTSSQGVLDVSIVDRITNVTINGTANISARVWNGNFSAPNLKAVPGDRVILRFWNYLPEPTNVHFHGLHVAPVTGADNVSFVIAPGAYFAYNFSIPLWHPQGCFWYHSHAMSYRGEGLAEQQVFNGMAGVLYIGELFSSTPALSALKQNVLSLRDFYLDPVKLAATGERALPTQSELEKHNQTTRLVSGLFQPQVAMDQGETQLFTVANTGADIMYNLTLQPPSEFQVVAMDGNLQNKPVAARYYLLGPGSRVEFLWQAPAVAGPVRLVTNELITGSEGDFYPFAELATLQVSNAAASVTTTVPATFAQVVDLGTAPVAVTRNVVFSNLDDGNFSINGLTFKPGRVDIVATLGTVELWNISNTAMELHTFHIHQGTFQVVSVNGVAQPFNGGSTERRLCARAHSVPGDRGHVPLPLPRPLARGPRHDGHHSSRRANVSGRHGALARRSRRPRRCIFPRGCCSGWHGRLLVATFARIGVDFGRHGLGCVSRRSVACNGRRCRRRVKQVRSHAGRCAPTVTVNR